MCCFTNDGFLFYDNNYFLGRKNIFFVQIFEFFAMKSCFLIFFMKLLKEMPFLYSMIFLNSNRDKKDNNNNNNNDNNDNNNNCDNNNNNNCNNNNNNCNNNNNNNNN